MSSISQEFSLEAPESMTAEALADIVRFVIQKMDIPVKMEQSGNSTHLEISAEHLEMVTKELKKL